jgi:GNAT superfamily N-acetyltransferase
MRIEGFDPVADTARIQACHELYAAGHPVDDPGMPMMSLPVFAGWFSLGWTHCPREAWLVPGNHDGSASAACLLELPVSENKHAGTISLMVAPGERRGGIGTALLRHAAGRMAGLGRTLLSGDARQGSPGWAFAVAAGARRGVTETRRVLDLARVPEGLLGTLRDRAGEAARGYTVLSWRGPCPQEYLEQVAGLINAFEDAPLSPGEEAERMTGLRVRQTELRVAVQGLRHYTVVARHDATGELAGLTQFGVDPLQPDWGFQELTAVARPHRGHRLGLLVKVAMLDLLATAEPGLEHIITANADGNRHMIAINAALGFRTAERFTTWQLDVGRDGVTSAQPAAGRHSFPRGQS